MNSLDEYDVNPDDAIKPTITQSCIRSIVSSFCAGIVFGIFLVVLVLVLKS